jgi:hypothetical protein
MLVHHICYYLADSSGIAPRLQDCESSNVVRCLKGTAVSGVASLKVGEVSIRLNELNPHEFLMQVWNAIGQLLGRSVKSQAPIVPIPDSGRAGELSDVPLCAGNRS